MTDPRTRAINLRTLADHLNAARALAAQLEPHFSAEEAADLAKLTIHPESLGANQYTNSRAGSRPWQNIGRAWDTIEELSRDHRVFSAPKEPTT